jgi:hypothetical protein
LKSGFRIDGNRILLAQPVMLDGKREGTLYLVADLRAMTSQLLKVYGGIFALVLAASLLLAFLLSRQFLRFVTNPILALLGQRERSPSITIIPCGLPRSAVTRWGVD